MNIKLISFVVCPYVQKAVITLKYKKADFEIEYIDLKNKPSWFLQISPMGKVPVLLLNQKDIIFESSVINELLDEIVGEQTLSIDPVERAKERAWIAYADYLFSDMYAFINTPESELHGNKLLDKLEKLSDVISDSKFFKSTGFSIIDSSYAPCFKRMMKFQFFQESPRLMKMKKVRRWIDNLLEQEYVINSVREDFDLEFSKYVANVNKNLKLYSPVQCGS